MSGTVATELPPGPRAPATVNMARLVQRPFASLLGWHRRYGDLFTVKLPVFGTGVYVCDPDAIRDLFTGDQSDLRAGEANAPLSPVLGDRSVLVLDGSGRPFACRAHLDRPDATLDHRPLEPFVQGGIAQPRPRAAGSDGGIHVPSEHFHPPVLDRDRQERLDRDPRLPPHPLDAGEGSFVPIAAG